MNSRIEQLKQHSYVTKDGEFCFDGGKVEILDVNKFAELIVRECANIVQDSPWQLPQGYKSVDQAKLVRKYFGVEE